MSRCPRTLPGAYMYRTVTHYTSSSTSKTHHQTEVFKTLYPVAERVASANGMARYLRAKDANPAYGEDARGGWSDFSLVIAEYLTDDGWQPVDHADLFPEVFNP